MIALNAAARAQAETVVTRVYPVGSVPQGADRAYPYAVLSVSFSDAEAYTLDARHGVIVLRLTTQSFGRTLDAAVDIDDLLRGAFLDESLTAPGYDCDPFELQVAGAIVNDPSAGQVVGVTSTYLCRAIRLESEES